ncbi:hypothetical protein AtDm6_1335 [Acetobacter tropicalis]|uniref:Uncharacterized protein n=1 Tax=Acetobacter tropicalis TaxID=104102 RepID=A0A094YTE9_9PROT|nr:hypothetical protein AtDm6_1335 [Acetobacter tropicalis]
MPFAAFWGTNGPHGSASGLGMEAMSFFFGTVRGRAVWPLRKKPLSDALA